MPFFLICVNSSFQTFLCGCKPAKPVVNWRQRLVYCICKISQILVHYDWDNSRSASIHFVHISFSTSYSPLLTVFTFFSHFSFRILLFFFPRLQTQVRSFPLPSHYSLPSFALSFPHWKFLGHRDPFLNRCEHLPTTLTFQPLAIGCWPFFEYPDILLSFNCFAQQSFRHSWLCTEPSSAS